jgi:hypothetical protein
MYENNMPKQRRGVTLRTPEDCRRLVQRICSRAFQENSELEHAGRISQLLSNWLKAYELSMELEDLRKLKEEVAALKEQMNDSVWHGGR